MNEKEISEIRRRFRPDRSGISHIRGSMKIGRSSPSSTSPWG